MIPLCDVRRQNELVFGELQLALSRVLASGRYILGPEVERFEGEAATYLGVAHAVGVASGTAALWCGLRALDIGPGAEVVTTAFSFFATAEAIALTGATPVFADVEPDSFQLNAQAVRRVLTEKTRAILVVHGFGFPANLPALSQVAREAAVPLVEDAAQAFGGEVSVAEPQGLGADSSPSGNLPRGSGAQSASARPRKLGSLGQLGCFSFFPSKPLGTVGDAGLIVTDRADLAERCRALRVHGATNKHEHMEIGHNHRMSPLQAAALSVKLPRLDGFLARRRRLVQSYNRAFSDLPLVCPRLEKGDAPACAHYTLRVSPEQREALGAYLAEHGVSSAVYYPKPLSDQPALAGRCRSGELPNTYQACSEVLSLPLFPELADAEQAHVVAAVRGFFGRRKRVEAERRSQ